MKIQGLAVLSIIIILPMAIILNAYSSNQIKTLQFQTSYDNKLINATHDAIKAFQLNMSNSSTSNIADSKIRDIQASVTTFYNSLSSNFNMSGYGEDVLKNYVPAIVYTLYDGYYIYSAYTNTLDPNDNFDADATYTNGETIYGLKPYIYYSCRYKPNSNSDFVITYSLDSYITIQGVINGNEVNDSGYLLTGVTNSGNTYYYKGIEILDESGEEGLKQNVYVEGDTSPNGTPVKIEDSNGNENEVGRISYYPYKKINGVKYYQDNSGNVFSIINDKKFPQDQSNITQNDLGIQYYKEALEFTNRVMNQNQYDLKDLKASDAVDQYGNKYSEEIYTEYDIFKVNANQYIEDEDSNFNAHKLQVIRNSIESNLIVAISNYNNVSTSSVNFAMPRLQDYEWEQITQNVSMITFLQGLNIGGKVYNGHAIVSNDKNEDFVSEDSIYILDTSGGQYYKVTDSALNSISTNNLIGILSTDFERRTAQATYEEPVLDEYGNQTYDSDGNLITKPIENLFYYYPRKEYASYSSIINWNGNSGQTISDYFNGVTSSDGKKYELAQLYYTALGRERYGMYRVNNKINVNTRNIISRRNCTTW